MDRSKSFLANNPGTNPPEITGTLWFDNRGTL